MMGGPVDGRRIASQLREDMMMKLVARICGVLSVLFLGVCILACAARSEKSSTKGGEKDKADVEKDGKEDGKKDGKKPG